ncbi:hypothetical protein F8388_026972 [Cannabis sativa]|uniref:Transposase MuDR plant domain-containing protein n=1 Tax=Cannabis sativa TaxID=3483 RepID=A0A7J6EFP5_CANSA|nr:hypothetical protein F8388_026972 [Cannabis sativa]
MAFYRDDGGDPPDYGGNLDYLTLAIHHGGMFFTPFGNRKYEGGKVNYFDRIDKEQMSRVFIEGFVLSVGYKLPFGMLYKAKDRALRDGSMILDDRDVQSILYKMEMRKWTEMDVYLVMPEMTLELEWKNDLTVVPHVPELPTKLQHCVIEELPPDADVVSDVVGISEPIGKGKDRRGSKGKGKGIEDGLEESDYEGYCSDDYVIFDGCGPQWEDPEIQDAGEDAPPVDTQPGREDEDPLIYQTPTDEPRIHQPTINDPMMYESNTFEPTPPQPTRFDTTPDFPCAFDTTPDFPTTFDPTPHQAQPFDPIPPQPTTLDPIPPQPTTIDPTPPQPTTLDPIPPHPNPFHPSVDIPVNQPNVIDPTTSHHQDINGTQQANDEQDFEFHEEEYEQDVQAERNIAKPTDPSKWWSSVTNFCSQGGEGNECEGDGVESEDDLQSLASGDEEGEVRKNSRPEYNPQCDKACFQFKKGMIFANVEVFRKALREHFIANDRDFKYISNDQRRVRATCKGNGCEWLIFASRVNSDESTFQVKKLEEEHTCGIPAQPKKRGRPPSANPTDATKKRKERLMKQRQRDNATGLSDNANI